MTTDEIMAEKMAKDLHQIREQLLALSKYQTNLLGVNGWDTLVRMYADAERLDLHLRRRWNTPIQNPTQPMIGAPLSIASTLGLWEDAQ